MKETADKPSNNGQKIERNAKGQLQKGVILNPNGKPKGTKHFNTLFNELLKETITLKGEDGKPITMTMLRAMGIAMARKAIKGDVMAFNAVSDRLDGKPMQSMELEVSAPPMPILPLKNRGAKLKVNANQSVSGNNSDAENNEPDQKD